MVSTYVLEPRHSGPRVCAPDPCDLFYSSHGAIVPILQMNINYASGYVVKEGRRARIHTSVCLIALCMILKASTF